MSLRIVIIILIWYTTGIANAGDIPCSLKKFSIELDERVDSSFSVESVRKLLVDSYGIKAKEINRHTYETPATLNTRKGEITGIKSRFNVILKRCHPVSAFFLETWFSGHFYFNDKGQLIADEYFYTVDSL